MRQLRYSVASSLDGFIAGPDGEYDWIVVDPDIDFAAMYAGFSGLVMGRKSYDVYVATGGGEGPALPVYVCSRTLPEGTKRRRHHHPRRGGRGRPTQARRGKPLWLWGGGELFAELARADLVDGVDVAVIPVILGSGIPLMPPEGPAAASPLARPPSLRGHRHDVSRVRRRQSER